MNTANLQLEGLLLAMSSVLDALREKGLMDASEIDAALERAESAARADARRPEELSPANVEAVLFPIRFLRATNARPGTDPFPAFSAVATSVGEAKRRPQSIS